MKKSLVGRLAALSAMLCIPLLQLSAQEQRLPFSLYDNQCVPASEDTSASLQAGRSSANGFRFTPKGELNILVIYAGFTNDNLNPNIAGNPDPSPIQHNNNTTTGTHPNTWPQLDAAHPDPINDWGKSLPPNYAQHFYANGSTFSLGATDNTLSNFYYQMSRPLPAAERFQVTAGYFPDRVNITIDTAVHVQKYSSYANLVIRKARQLQPNFDWSPYDKHRNYPNYNFSADTTGPDGIIDYVIIIWRVFGPAKDAQGNDIPGTASPFGCRKGKLSAGGAVAYMPSVDSIPSSTPSVLPSGLFSTGWEGHQEAMGVHGISRNITIHEMAHTMYESPHLFGANGIHGSHFYSGNGPGMMADVQTYFSANAWERWYAGWTELHTGSSQTVSDIKGASDLAATSGTYTLRDHLASGDAVRIRIPHAFRAVTNGDTIWQHLWLENRQDLANTFNQRDGGYRDTCFQPTPQGIIAYVEGMVEDRNLVGMADGQIYANKLKILSCAGHFDSRPQGIPDTYQNHLFGNRLINFSPRVPNPTSAHNEIAFMRDNFLDFYPNSAVQWQTTGGIGYQPGSNQAQNEWRYFVIENQAPTSPPPHADGLFGPNIGFNQAGQKMGLSYNPVICGLQTYNSGTASLSSINLNGLSVTIIGKAANGDITIKVRYDDTDINRDTRLTGNLVLRKVPGTPYALNVKPLKTLLINQSGTPNRHSISPLTDDFINPTSFRVEAGA